MPRGGFQTLLSGAAPPPSPARFGGAQAIPVTDWKSRRDQAKAQYEALSQQFDDFAGGSVAPTRENYIKLQGLVQGLKGARAEYEQAEGQVESEGTVGSNISNLLLQGQSERELQPSMENAPPAPLSKPGRSGSALKPPGR